MLKMARLVQSFAYSKIAIFLAQRVSLKTKNRWLQTQNFPRCTKKKKKKPMFPWMDIQRSGQTFVTLTRSSATWSFTCFDLFCVTCNVAVPLNVGPCWTYLLETCDLPLCLQCWRFVSTFGECSSQEFNLLDYVFCLPEKNLPDYALLTSPLICGIT